MRLILSKSPTATRPGSISRRLEWKRSRTETGRLGGRISPAGMRQFERRGAKLCRNEDNSKRAELTHSRFGLEVGLINLEVSPIFHLTRKEGERLRDFCATKNLQSSTKLSNGAPVRVRLAATPSREIQMNARPAHLLVLGGYLLLLNPDIAVVPNLCIRNTRS